VNRGGSESLAGAAADAGVRRFIYISSVTVHGMAANDRIDESSPVRSVGLPYADSKIEAERSLEAMHERGRIDLTILRPGDVYGPRAGEWVVKLVQALRARKMILIDGGRGLINTTFVENLADAVLAALSRGESKGRAYLITDGAPVRWKRYLVALSSACGARPPSISIPSALAWPLVVTMEAALSPLGKKPPLGRMGLRLLTARSGYSIERARRELGWSPAVGFDEGMRRVGDWLRQAMPV
jgi:nucleoside-diphosphate-sugar epimerase